MKKRIIFVLKKLEIYRLFSVFFILLSLLVFLLKDLKTLMVGKNTAPSQDDSSKTLFDAQYYNALGNSLMLESKFNESIIAFNKSIELSKNTKYFYVSYSGRAHTKFNLKDCNGTIKDAKIALTGNKKIWDMYSLIGICEYVNSNYKNSVDNLTTAISLVDKNNPELWRIFTYKGASEMYLDNLENAKESFFKALELNKNYYLLYNGIYLYYMRIKDYKNASIYFEKASSFPENISYTYYNDGVRIYQQLFYLSLDQKNSEKMKTYGALALKNVNKLYKLRSNAESNFRLCEVKITLNTSDFMQVCREAMARAKQEKNEALYKEIYDLIN